MTSYRTGISGNRRAAARLVAKVHRQVQKAYDSRRRDGVTQTSIANAIGVHRSVINRQLNGREDISVSRIGELAWALSYEADFDMKPVGNSIKPTNAPAITVPAATKTSNSVVHATDAGKTWSVSSIKIKAAELV